MSHLSSHHFIPTQRETSSTFYIIPAFPPFSPSIINLFHHLAGELVFPLRQHVILPTHSIKQCPCTTTTLRLCPLPAHNSQRFSSLRIKELCCLSPFSSSSFPSWLSQACVFQGQGMLPLISSIFYFPPLFISHALNRFQMYLSHIKNMGGRNHGWMDGWMDRVNARMCG